MKMLIAILLIVAGVWLFNDGWRMRASLKGNPERARRPGPRVDGGDARAEPVEHDAGALRARRVRGVVRPTEAVGRNRCL
jgi:hypothetical protein